MLNYKMYLPWSLLLAIPRNYSIIFYIYFLCTFLVIWVGLYEFVLFLWHVLHIDSSIVFLQGVLSILGTKRPTGCKYCSVSLCGFIVN